MHSRKRHRPLSQVRHAPPKAPPPPPAARRLQCVCGRGIDVLPEHAGWRGRCPTCFRDFEILFSRDASGAAIVSLAYLDDGKAKSDTAAETSMELGPGTSKKAGALTEIGLTPVPDPPDEAQFRCGCGALLSITRERYDKRVKCPACGKRRLVTLAYDEASQGYTLHTFVLEDRPSGDTRVALRLS